jgi:hypothetical protein
MMRGYALEGGNSVDGYQVLVEELFFNMHAILPRKWYMSSVVPLTLMDKLRLLFGRKLVITFSSLDGECNAACSFLFDVR